MQPHLLKPPLSRGIDGDAIRDQLAQILQSDSFARSERMKRFLHYVVEQTLAGQEDSLKEYTIAVSVFDKPDSFDPRIDPIVRVEASRLRSKLRQYYDSEGGDKSLIISLKKRSYVAAFETKARRAFPSGVIADGIAGPAMLAVLPFTDFSAKRDQGYFCDGIAEELINALSRVEGLQVAPRTSVMRYKGGAHDIRQIGKQLKASAVLEGSVRKDGNRIRISVQLISVSDGVHLWSEAYNRTLNDVLRVQEEVSLSIVRALRRRLASPGVNLHFGTEDPQAYQFYLRARRHCQRGGSANLRQAIKWLHTAVQADPRYAQAFAALSDCFLSQTWLGVIPPSNGLSQAMDSAQRALEIDGTLGEALASMGALTALYYRDFARSEKQLRRAIEVDPQSAAARQWRSLLCLTPQGKLREALAELRQAQRLDPGSPVLAADMGRILYFAGHHQAAVDQFQHAISLDESSSIAHCHLGFALDQLSRADDAMRSFERARDLAADDPIAISAFGYGLARAGDFVQAARTLDELKAASRKRYVSPLDLATIHVGMGHAEDALNAIETAWNTHCSRLIHLHVDPVFEPLKSHSHFQDFVARLMAPSAPPSLQ